MKAGDFSRVERDAVAQVEAGAHMLDVNAGASSWRSPHRSTRPRSDRGSYPADS
jgi:cobalamin-dependent methionine synthase I